MSPPTHTRHTHTHANSMTNGHKEEWNIHINTRCHVQQFSEFHFETKKTNADEAFLEEASGHIVPFVRAISAGDIQTNSVRSDGRPPLLASGRKAPYWPFHKAAYKSSMTHKSSRTPTFSITHQTNRTHTLSHQTARQLAP